MAYSDYHNLVKPQVLNVVAANVGMRLTQRNAVNF
jgi:hypothetical protein